MPNRRTTSFQLHNSNQLKLISFITTTVYVCLSTQMNSDAVAIPLNLHSGFVNTSAKSTYVYVYPHCYFCGFRSTLLQNYIDKENVLNGQHMDASLTGLHLAPLADLYMQTCSKSTPVYCRQLRFIQWRTCSCLRLGSYSQRRDELFICMHMFMG